MRKIGILSFSLFLVQMSAPTRALGQSAGQSALLANQTQIADARPPVGNPTVLPTDVTPAITGSERSLLSRDLRFAILKRLPESLWFNTSTEVSQRLETNPLFLRNGRSHVDYALRVNPNVSVGYNFLQHTGIYCNYFVIKDVFAHYHRIGRPTTQSVSMGLRQDFPIGQRTNVQLDFQARELWQASHLHQADLIPTLSITRVVSPNVILFGSTLLQMRGREYFVAPTRELDPFYSTGIVVRRGNWTFQATDTLVTNFRDPPFHKSIPRHGAVSMIADFEINRPVSMKAPGLVWFVRAEPVWNWRSGHQPGQSGFDYRLFGGLRLAVSKQPYNAAIDRLKQQIIESEDSPHGK